MSSTQKNAPENMPDALPNIREKGPSAPEAETEAMSPAQALDLLVQNPVAFVRSIVDQAARMHLADLKEEAELRGAMQAFRKNYPEFDRFEPFILQEVARLIREDEDGVIYSWPTLLEKGMQNFRGKLSETVRAAQDGNDTASSPDPPRIEASANRKLPTPPPSFTRDQISRMSLEDFLKHEDAINTALQERRIR